MNGRLESEIQLQVERWKQDTGKEVAWDARRMVNDLSKDGQHELAVEHGNRALEIWNDFGPLSSTVAWALYRKDLAEITEESNLQRRRHAKESVDRIKLLCSSDPYNTYSPWPNAVLKFSSALSKRWPSAALDFLMQLDPSELSAERNEKFPANRARWFLLTSKALEAAERWDELLRTCDAALDEQCVDRQNQKWIRLRQAEAWRHLGRAEEAEFVIGAEAKSSGDWWLYARWAKVLAELDRKQEAVNAAYLALMAGGATSFGWETLALVGELLEESEQAIALDHVRLSRCFREQEGWPPNQTLEDLANRLDSRASESEIDVAELLSRLKKVWRKVGDLEREVGTVLKLLNDGAGFIGPDSGGGALFFSLPKGSKKQMPYVGDRVSFVRQNSFDKKKDRESERAAKWECV